jgi:hypothetical protein
MTCRTPANTGEAVCGNCRNGFVSKMGCASCSKIVPSGYSYCPDCARNVNVESSAIARPEIRPGALPALSLPPGLSLEHAYVPEVKYNAGKFGVTAVVAMSGHDADIMTKMNQVAMMLHALAAEMNTFQGIGESTRGVIRGCRDLATRLQEEVEVRRGPL